MYKIRDWLYVAGFTAASDDYWLRYNGINALLSLFKPIDHLGITCAYLQVDNGDALSTRIIEEGAAFIQQQIQQKNTLVITCSAGLSRSVTFALIALKEAEGLSLKEALLEVRHVHKEAMPDQAHWESLRRYYGEADLFWDVWQEIMQQEHAFEKKTASV